MTKIQRILDTIESYTLTNGEKMLVYRGLMLVLGEYNELTEDGDMDAIQNFLALRSTGRMRDY